MKENATLKSILSGLSPIVVAALGSLFVFLGMDWFDGLNKPTQWPSSVIFPVMWTVVYSIAAVILFRWSGRGMPKSVAVLFIVNGALNVLWCLLFFTLHLTFIGLAAIILNMIAGYLLIFEIKKSVPAYFYALLIYPAWLGIATALNLAVWILN